MELYLLGFAVAVPSTTADKLLRARQGARQEIDPHVTASSATIRTFDGLDAGWPQIRAVNVNTPFYLGKQAASQAGEVDGPMKRLEQLAYAGAHAGLQAQPDALLAFVWKESHRSFLDDVEALVVCGSAVFRTTVSRLNRKTDTGITGLLQGELLEAVRTTPGHILAESFPWARQAQLEGRLDQSQTLNNPKPRL